MKELIMLKKPISKQNKLWSKVSKNSTAKYKSFPFFLVIELILHVKGRGSFELAAGQHQIPFSFALPAQIPSSFEGTYGHVRYRIKAFLKGTFMKSDYKREILFPVNTIVDLNMLTYFERAVLFFRPVKKNAPFISIQFIYHLNKKSLSKTN